MVHSVECAADAGCRKNEITEKVTALQEVVCLPSACRPSARRSMEDDGLASAGLFGESGPSGALRTNLNHLLCGPIPDDTRAAAFSQARALQRTSRSSGLPMPMSVLLRNSCHTKTSLCGASVRPSKIRHADAIRRSNVEPLLPSHIVAEPLNAYFLCGAEGAH